MRMIPLAAFALAVACSPGDRAPEAEAAAAAPLRAEAAAPPERYTLTIERGGTTILSERVTRTAERLESEMTAGPSEGRLTYTAVLNPDGTVSRLDGRLAEAGAGSQPAPNARLTLVFQGDSATLEVAEGDSTRRERIGVAPGTIPIPVSEAVAVLEQYLYRARAMGGATAEIPVLTLEKGVKTGTATVTFRGADSATVVFRGEDSSTEIHARTDAAGRLLGARVSGSGLVIRRTPAP
jgi:hypothetical protein